MARSFPFPLRKLAQLYHLVRESHQQPLSGEPRLMPVAAIEETSVTFIGHSSFLVQTAGLGVLIDPVFSTRLVLLRRQRRAGVLVGALPRVDAVLLTHAHMDHLDRPSLRAVTREMHRRGLPAPVVIVPDGVADLVAGLGFRSITELRWWESTSLSLPLSPSPARPSSVLSFPNGVKESASRPAAGVTLTITATPCKHWGARLFRDTHRGFGGYVLSGPSVPTLYHSGDTARFSGFTEIGRRLRPEIAMLPIGAYFPDSYRAVHTSPEEALEAFQDLGAATLIPMHYGSFRLGREPMSEPLPRLLAAARREGLAHRIRPLTEGETWIPGNRFGAAELTKPEVALSR